MIKLRKIIFIGYLFFSAFTLAMETVPEAKVNQPTLDFLNVFIKTETVSAEPLGALTLIPEASEEAISSNTKPDTTKVESLETEPVPKNQEPAIKHPERIFDVHFASMKKILEEKNTKESESVVYSDDEVPEEPSINLSLPLLVPTPTEKEFNNIPNFLSFYKKMEDYFSLALQNMARNRYGDNLPLDSNGIKVQVVEEQEGEIFNEERYINASLIKSYMPIKDTKKYIATQAPMADDRAHLKEKKCTFPEFWLMIWQQEIPVIMMVTDYFEKKNKAERYFPLEVGDSREYKWVTVSTIEKKDLGFAHATLLKLTKDGKERFVYHLHYTKWQDDAGVSANDMVQLLAAQDLCFDEAKKSSENVSTVVVHCSAGIGRTGSLIAMAMYKEFIEQPGNIVMKEGKVVGEIPVLSNVVEMLRRQRDSVKTFEQYEAIAQVVNLLFQNWLVSHY